MIPLIIAGGTQEVRTKEIMDMFPAHTFALIKVVAGDRSIGIAQIQDLVKTVSITSHVSRLIWIEEAGTMTTAAQNALLKVLEEPPVNVQFVLSIENPRILLETVRSRCTVKLVTHDAQGNVSWDMSVVRTAMGKSAGDRVLAADQLGRKREIALEWVLGTMREVNRIMAVEKSPKALGILTEIGTLLTSAYTDLHANVSVSLVMQNVFLRLPRTHS